MRIESRLLELKAIKTITSITKQKQAAKLFSQVDLDDFYWEETKEAFTRIMTLLRKRGTLPNWSSLITDPRVSEETRESLRKYKKPPTSNIDELVSSLNEYKKLRRIYSMCKEGLDTLRGNSIDIDKLVQNLHERVVALNTSKNREEWFVHIGGDDDTGMQTVEKALDPEQQLYIPTGFKAFDNINQGLPLGALMMIASTTGAGKSIVATQLATNAAMAGYRVCIVPLEMTNEEIMQRQLARNSSVDMTEIMNPKGLSKDKLRKIKEDYVENLHKKIKKRGGLLSYYNPEEDQTIEEILYALEPYDYDLIVVDYVGLLGGVDGDDQWKALKRVTRFAKMYGKTNKKVICLAAQLTDEGNLRFAKSMKDDCNLFWRWNITPDAKETGVIKVVQDKARNQVDHDFYLKIIWKYMQVVDTEAKDDKKSTKNNDKSKPNNYLDDDF